MSLDMEWGWNIMEAEFTVPESGKTSVLLLKDPNNYMVHNYMVY